MQTSLNHLPCDGCGLPASPEHIAERVRRLELCTRFRPVHIGVLFIALAPSKAPEDDFYHPAESKEFFDPFLDALQIHSATHDATLELDMASRKSGMLLEFQRRGYHLAYLSECPISAGMESAGKTIARLGPTLTRRIRFNYRPKHVAAIGQELLFLVDLLRTSKIDSIVTQDSGQLLPVPRTGDREGLELLRRAVATVSPREYLSPGYDRIQLTQPERDWEAGGNS